MGSSYRGALLRGSVCPVADTPVRSRIGVAARTTPDHGTGLGSYALDGDLKTCCDCNHGKLSVPYPGTLQTLLQCGRGRWRDLLGFLLPRRYDRVDLGDCYLGSGDGLHNNDAR